MPIDPDKSPPTLNNLFSCRRSCDDVKERDLQDDIMVYIDLASTGTEETTSNAVNCLSGSNETISNDVNRHYRSNGLPSSTVDSISLEPPSDDCLESQGLKQSKPDRVSSKQDQGSTNPDQGSTNPDQAVIMLAAKLRPPSSLSSLSQYVSSKGAIRRPGVRRPTPYNPIPVEEKKDSTPRPNNRIVKKTFLVPGILELANKFDNKDKYKNYDLAPNKGSSKRADKDINSVATPIPNSAGSLAHKKKQRISGENKNAKPKNTLPTSRLGLQALVNIQMSKNDNNAKRASDKDPVTSRNADLCADPPWLPAELRALRRAVARPDLRPNCPMYWQTVAKVVNMANIGKAKRRTKSDVYCQKKWMQLGNDADFKSKPNTKAAPKAKKIRTVAQRLKSSNKIYELKKAMVEQTFKGTSDLKIIGSKKQKQEKENKSKENETPSQHPHSLDHNTRSSVDWAFLSELEELEELPVKRPSLERNVAKQFDDMDLDLAAKDVKSIMAMKKRLRSSGKDKSSTNRIEKKSNNKLDRVLKGQLEMNEILRSINIQIEQFTNLHEVHSLKPDSDIETELMLIAEQIAELLEENQDQFRDKGYKHDIVVDVDSLSEATRIVSIATNLVKQ